MQGYITVFQLKHTIYRPMFSSLSSWLSGSSEPGKEGEGEGREKDGSEETKEGESQPQSKTEATTATSWSGLFSSVTGYATTIKDTVTETVKTKTFIGEFEEEQKRFEREQRRQRDAAVPPWVGFNENEQMKAQMLELSADSRNVLRNPPPGVQFLFDFAKSYPVAMATLKEDPRLQKLRFELVPKKISEERFWHNYFYRVFLIKQSSQLATLSSAEHKTDTTAGEGGEGEEQPSSQSQLPATFSSEVTDSVGQQSPVQESDFASDALVVGESEGEQVTISRESVRDELGQLGVTQEVGVAEGEGQWDLEEELARELEDLGLEAEGEGTNDHVDSEQWENEIQKMLEMHDDQ